MHSELFLRFLLIILGATSISCNKEKDTSTKDNIDVGYLHTVADVVEQSKSVLNSHAGEEQWSSLQPMYSTGVLLSHEFLIGDCPQKFANYPRIKKMRNGEYIMFYHAGQTGTKIWSTTSKNLQTWNKPVLLYEPEQVTVNGVTDWRRYVNMDAVVLDNGDILSVCSFRHSSLYNQGLGCGIMIQRSTDNGKSWSQAMQIYDGPNWEPYLLSLPDNRLQCYFTDCIPLSRNSGTSVIESFDGGKTWGTKKRVCRQYKYQYDGPYTEYTGQNIYTDQMPCFRLLNDGKTIVGFLEARLEDPPSIQGNSYYCVSLVYNDGFDWKDLGENSAGPARRYTNIIRGGSGYVSTFPSGEVIVSANMNNLFQLKILDHDAELPEGSTWDDGWMVPFDGKGFWGCTEIISNKTLVAAMHTGNGETSGGGIQIIQCYLNQRLDAEVQSINIDGNSKEWNANDALYICSKAGDESLLFARHDENDLYLDIETKAAERIEKIPTIYLRVSTPKGNKILDYTVSPSGELSLTGGTPRYASARAISSNQNNGMVTELAIPLKDLGVGSGDYVLLQASSKTASSTVSFSNTDIDSPLSWPRILLK